MNKKYSPFCIDATIATPRSIVIDLSLWHMGQPLAYICYNVSR